MARLPATSVLPDDGIPQGTTLVPGDVFAARWTIEARLGAGAMGAVYRALDAESGERVALKVLHPAVSTRRFDREAALLAELSHPAIVKYLGHGIGPAQTPYLVMELLVGDTLSERLRGKPLPLAPTVTLVRRIAEALGVAHDRGVVHRDIKPGNLFLEEGDLGRVKVLDFGIARPMHDPDGLTHTGSMVGTPGYMAPEQVRGARQVDARADVFALGCVFYECLTGEPAFYAHDVLALLSRILFDEPRAVRSLNPSAPPELAALCHRMLAKEIDKRPASGRSVAEALTSLGSVVDRASEPPARGAGEADALGDSELRILGVVLAMRALGGGPTGDGADDEESTGPVTSDEDDPALLALRKSVEPFGARLEALMDGSVVATIAERGAATDRAAQAARCALALRRELPRSPMSLATGRGEVAARLPMGEAIDRAAILARAARTIRARAGTLLPIRIDSVTAGLLDARFSVHSDGAAHLLLGERDSGRGARTLLGRATPLVGREHELAALATAFDRCVAAREPGAALLVGGAGAGKSRLAQELARHLDALAEQASARTEAPELWLARGDPLRQGSPFSLLAQTVARAAGLGGSEPLMVRQHKLRARVDRAVPGADRQRVTEFLGELVGTPFAAEGSVQLRAARQDPILMGDQMRRAWEDWARAESARRPVLLLLEDVQWGDQPSLTAVAQALGHLAHRPFFGLALGRPEVDEAFPELWAELSPLRIEVGPLSAESTAALAREVLGPDVDAATVAWLCEHSEGNALYLEELIRTVAEGKAGSFPGTLLAMVQARLEALPPETRRVLRAASVFGGGFYAHGVRALLGGVERPLADVERHLADLVQRELCSLRPAREGVSEIEYAFRHALVREAAYESLLDDDRRLGHRLAAEWLEISGETEAVLMAKHFERAREPARAARWFARAAEEALEGNDLPAVIERAERAIDCGAADMAGVLRALQAEAHRWRAETPKVARRSAEAMEALPRGSPPWFAALAEMAIAESRLGNHDHLRSAANVIDEALLRSTVSRELALAAAQMITELYAVGRPERAERLHERLEAAADRSIGGSDPIIAARLWTVRGWRAAHAGNPLEQAHHLLRSIEGFDQAGDLRGSARERTNLGFAYCELGLHAEAEEELDLALSSATRMGLWGVAAVARQNLAKVMSRTGRPDEALRLIGEALAVFRRQGNRRMEASAGIVLALVLVARGDLEKAELAARAAAETAVSPPDRCQADAALAEVLLQRHKYAEARDAAEAAHGLLDGLRGLNEGEARVRRVWAGRGRSGAVDVARSAAAAARRRLLARAAAMDEPLAARAFLEDGPDNVRTMDLVRDLQDE
ncbi:MAG: protein kinase [Polyangiaceae bacterium]